MARFAYFDKDRVPITAQKWLELQKDESYVTRYIFDNAKVRVSIEWIGRMDARDQVGLLPEFWPMFKVRVLNYVDGSLIADPVEDGVTYGSESAARERVESFLTKWTECVYVVKSDGSYRFVEEGNTLAPPEPPNPDKPQSDVAILDDGVGAW